MVHPFIKYLADRDLIPASASQQLMAKISKVREPIGMIAINHGLLQAPHIDIILDRQRECPARFGQIAVELAFLSPEQVETLIQIQEFRTAGAIAEILALSGVLDSQDAIRYFGAFLAHDEEVGSLIAEG